MWEGRSNDTSAAQIREKVIDGMSRLDKWTDHMLVSKNGTNPNQGSCHITATSHPGPRRLAFSVERHPPRWDALHNCHIIPMYGYAYAFVPKWWMGCNSLRYYETLNKLGIQLWKDVWEFLDPLSQVCPPTGGSLLTYFGCFGGKIQPHQDNNHRSICSTAPKRSHGSLYLMSAFTDVKTKHQVTFRSTEKQRKGAIRVGIAWRWLSRRTYGFGDDYQQERKHCEVWDNCNELAAEKFPNSEKCREIFRVPVGERRRS